MLDSDLEHEIMAHEMLEDPGGSDFTVGDILLSEVPGDVPSFGVATNAREIVQQAKAEFGNGASLGMGTNNESAEPDFDEVEHLLRSSALEVKSDRS